MSLVTFSPVPEKGDTDGWPNEVLGDGFITLRLYEIHYESDYAEYVDQFRDRYEFFGVDSEEWTVEVREDG